MQLNDAHWNTNQLNEPSITKCKQKQHKVTQIQPTLPHNSTKLKQVDEIKHTKV